MTTTERPQPRGRIDKRRDILKAAFTVFAREGFVGARVEAIAAEAGAAKPTVYAHFGDKQTLFHEALVEVARSAMSNSLEVVARLDETVPDVRTALEELGTDLLHCYGSDQAWTLRRLLVSECVRFPEVYDAVSSTGPAQVSQMLADRLARLTVAGRLGVAEPTLAAEQLVALLTSPMETRSVLGTRAVSEEKRRALVRSAVDTFLRAFAPDGDAGVDQGRDRSR